MGFNSGFKGLIQIINDPCVNSGHKKKTRIHPNHDTSL